ncbi:hypothetical protein B0H17DRAFT_1150980, partial [Mycena rosella]
MSWVIPEDVAPQLFAELIALREWLRESDAAITKTLPKGMLALLNELQKDYTSFPAQVSNSDPAAFPFDALEALNAAMRTTLSSPNDSSNSGMASSQSSTLVSASSATRPLLLRLRLRKTCACLDSALNSILGKRVSRDDDPSSVITTASNEPPIGSNVTIKISAK